MTTASWLARALLLLAAVTIAVIAGMLSCGSDNPTQPPTVTKPDITSFTGTPTDIAPGDSVLFTYAAVRADSLKLFPTGQKLANAASGSLYVKPSAASVFTLRAYNAGGQDSAKVTITMSSTIPVITALTASEDTIAVWDSTQVTWGCIRVDSVKLNGTLKLTPASGGTVWFKPPASGLLTLIAYNPYGSDTANFTVRIEIPSAIQALGGILYYKGDMGSNQQFPQMRFRVVDNFASPLYKVWMKFSLLEGDGTLSADSLRAEASGNALLTYNFDGTLGHAKIRAMVPGYDTVGVLVRASLIAPGTTTPGQYIKRGDSYMSVKGFNGAPLADTPDTAFFLNYIDYEAALGVVVIVEDTNHSSTSQDQEPVYGIILNTIYSGNTLSGWGIGDLVATLISEYGAATNVVFDPTPPAAWRYEWPTQGLTAYTTTEASEASRTVFEVHLTEPASGVQLKRSDQILK